MTCRAAPACRAVLDQADALWPHRKRASDGICASAAHHQQNPTSDHEPDAHGIAHAVDLTHDPAHGCDVDGFFADLIARREPRVKYLIRNRQITRSYKTNASQPEPWTPQAYTGPNPHEKHGHISVWTEHENDTSPWFDSQELVMDAEAKAAFAAINKRLDQIEADVTVARESLAGRRAPTADNPEKRSLTGRTHDDVLAVRKKVGA